MKTFKLSSIIKNEYLRSILYPLFIIETMLLVAYFWSNSYVNEATKKTLIEETKISAKEISKRSAITVNNEFKSITHITKLFQKEHENFFAFYNPQDIPTDNPLYFETQSGVISNTKSSQQSCTLFFSNVQKENANRMQKAIATQKLDPFYNSVLSTNENIAQVYFNSYDSMNRLCPFMDDALSQYPHDIDIPQYNFYFLADQKHNPNREVVWTEAYLDPAGQGWLISAIAPVYKDDFLEGVVGIDVTLEKIINNILSFELPYKSFAMLVDEKGNILAMNEGLEPLLGIKELKDHDYTSPISKTISKPKDFNILTNRSNDLAKNLGSMLENKSELKEFDSQNSSLIITQNSIPQTKWKLLMLIDKNSLLANTMELKAQTNKVGYIAIVLMGLFYTLFFFLILKRSQRFSSRILAPLDSLIEATNLFKQKRHRSKLSQSDIFEINELLNNFSHMSEEILSYIQELSDDKQTIQMLSDRFQLAIEGSNDGLWDWNIQTQEVYFSKQWKQMLGYTEDELPNDFEEWKKRVHPEDIENAMQDIQDHLSHKTDIYNNEHRMLHKNGSWIWILDRGKALFDADGNAVRMLGFHTDITLKKRYELNLAALVEEKTQEVLQTQKMLEQQSKLAALGEMISMLAHQWRQPLGSISAIVASIKLKQNLKKFDLSTELGRENQEKFLNDSITRLESHIKGLTTTIDDFREFFKPDEQTTKTSIPELITHVQSIFGQSLQDSAIEFITDITSQKRFESYPNKLVQVFINILKNSQDAFIERNIKDRRIELQGYEEDGNIILSFLDNAGGINEENLSKIFEPYFSTKEKKNGTGLGLYMSKNIIENHLQGSITAQNCEDGAQFTIILKV